MMAELFELTASSIVDLVQHREVSRREVVEAHFERVDEINPVVNALVEFRRDEVFEEAEIADRDHTGATDLRLDGVPICVKDHFDVKGMLHTEGVKAYADRRSTKDAPIISRLKAAGALIIGKANQPDFQIRGSTRNDLYGLTRNPRDLSLTAGGSSGGDAVSVATGMTALGFGVDYGGSIREPAQYCEIFGLRPSAGRVPQVDEFAPDAPLTLDMMSSNGPLARSVEDLGRALSVIAGPHPEDPASVPVPLREWTQAKASKVAVMVDETGARVTDEIRAAVSEAAEALRAGGYNVIEAAPPRAERVPDLWRQLLGTELMHYALPVWRPMVCDSGLSFMEALGGEFESEAAIPDYALAFIERRSIVRETAAWMEEHPLILAPVCGEPTPGPDFDMFMSPEEFTSWFHMYRNVVFVNCLGLPGLALPSGVQVIGRRFREDEVLAAAAAVERALAPCTVARSPRQEHVAD